MCRSGFPYPHPARDLIGDSSPICTNLKACHPDARGSVLYIRNPKVNIPQSLEMVQKHLSGLIDGCTENHFKNLRRLSCLPSVAEAGIDARSSRR